MSMVDQFNLHLLNQIPMTRLKISIARILYRVLHLILRRDQHLIRRKGIRYAVDIAEGIDLSIYLFGGFQDHVTRQKHFLISEDAVIFDVGANIGSMALKFAQLAPRGRIFAFEPTDFAYEKLLHNLSLNPQLAERIFPHQVFLSDRTRSDHQISAYASWKVDGSGSNTHPLHRGAIKSAVAVPAVSIDDFCRERNIQRVDFIKIDTDGHELPVIKGAFKTLEQQRPYLIFEIGLYVLKERGVTFEQYFEYLSALKYKLINAKNGKKITLKNIASQIPLRATTDIIAIPPGLSE